MGKFKVGDHVTGISEYETVETNAEVIYVAPDDYGDEFDIQIAGKDCDLWVNSKNFQLMDNDKPIFSSLEEIKPEESIQKVKKFKVGDHIKGLKGSGYYIANENLIDAEVMPEDSAGGNINIKCLRFLDGNAEAVGLFLTVDPKYFDYADGYSPVSGTVSSFVINGQEYTNEQYEKDCKRFLETFPDEKSFDLSYAMENILNVYQWAQRNPVVTNLDHYAEGFGWSEERKKIIADNFCPLHYMAGYCPRHTTCENCRKWWLREYQPKGAKCSTQ